MSELKSIGDLPVAQQKALFIILRSKRPGFRTSEIRDKMGEASEGRSVGAILGALSRNGYLERVSGGRDKTWKLSAGVAEASDDIQGQLKAIKQYWN